MCVSGFNHNHNHNNHNPTHNMVQFNSNPHWGSTLCQIGSVLISALWNLVLGLGPCSAFPQKTQQFQSPSSNHNKSQSDDVKRIQITLCAVERPAGGVEVFNCFETHSEPWVLNIVHQSCLELCIPAQRQKPIITLLSLLRGNMIILKYWHTA